MVLQILFVAVVRYFLLYLLQEEVRPTTELVQSLIDTHATVDAKMAASEVSLFSGSATLDPADIDEQSEWDNSKLLSSLLLFEYRLQYSNTVQSIVELFHTHAGSSAQCSRDFNLITTGREITGNEIRELDDIQGRATGQIQRWGACSANWATREPGGEALRTVFCPCLNECYQRFMLLWV